ncbi:MAG TPA: hypothetical protein VHT04_00765 [Stellaceae bacterium]|nr:hypothetical protein [Stellaceae bacterium]
MNTKTLARGIAACALVAALAGCTVYQPAYQHPAYYQQPAYYAPPAYAYAPAPYYAPAYGPTIGLGFGFGFGGGHWGHGHGEHGWHDR